MFSRRYANFWDGLFRPTKTHILGSSDVKTLTNLITNGDFSAGTTGWTSVGASNSVSNKIMSNTASGTATYGSFYTATANRFSATAGDRIYARIKWRLTNDRGTSLYASIVSGTPPYTSAGIIPSLGAPVKDQWYERSGIVAYPATSTTIGFYVYQYYANAADATGGVLEIDGNYGITVINLTELETVLGRQVSAEEMDDWIESIGWFDTTATYIANTNQWF